VIGAEGGVKGVGTRTWGEGGGDIDGFVQPHTLSERLLWPPKQQAAGVSYIVFSLSANHHIPSIP
jgi:hypothetical protein